MRHIFWGAPTYDVCVCFYFFLFLPLQFSAHPSARTHALIMILVPRIAGPEAISGSMWCCIHLCVNQCDSAGWRVGVCTRQRKIDPLLLRPPPHPPSLPLLLPPSLRLTRATLTCWLQDELVSIHHVDEHNLWCPVVPVPRNNLTTGAAIHSPACHR